MKKELRKRLKQRRLTTKIRLLTYFGAKTFESLSYAIMLMMFPRRQNKLQGLSIQRINFGYLYKPQAANVMCTLNFGYNKCIPRLDTFFDEKFWL